VLQTETLNVQLENDNSGGQSNNTISIRTLNVRY